MRCVFTLILLLYNSGFIFGQTKKNQIEYIKSRIDSIKLVQSEFNAEVKHQVNTISTKEDQIDSLLNSIQLEYDIAMQRREELSKSLSEKKNVFELENRKHNNSLDSIQNIKNYITEIKKSNLKTDPIIIKRSETNFNGNPDIIYWSKNNEPFSGLISENYILQFDDESEIENISDEEYTGPKYEISVIDGFLNGTWTEWYSNGQIQKIENYENGKRCGIQLYFSYSGDTLGYADLKNGNGTLVIRYSKEENKNQGVKVQQNFKDGLLNGLQQKWYNNGKIELKENYSLGVLNGEQFYYDYNGNLIGSLKLLNGAGDLIINTRLDGSLISLEKHYKNGHLNGKFVIQKEGTAGLYTLMATYINDVLSGKYIEITPGISGEKIEIDYNNGFIDGKYIITNNLGEKMIEKTYTHGILNGIQLEWYDNGVIKSNVNFLNGEAEGESFKYYKNGKESSKEVFKKGFRIKKYSYYENGNIRSESNYKNNQPDGKQTYYFQSGQVAEIWNCCSGWNNYYYCGLQQRFYSNGNIYMKGTITNGNGQLTYYNPNGSILKIEKYLNGKLLE
jgi:antitoxin component YwqK of YwqJK toxin-antitoxin module